MAAEDEVTVSVEDYFTSIIEQHASAEDRDFFMEHLPKAVGIFNRGRTELDSEESWEDKGLHAEALGLKKWKKTGTSPIQWKFEWNCQHDPEEYLAALWNTENRNKMDSGCKYQIIRQAGSYETESHGSIPAVFVNYFQVGPFIARRESINVVFIRKIDDETFEVVSFFVEDDKAPYKKTRSKNLGAYQLYADGQCRELVQIEIGGWIPQSAVDSAIPDSTKDFINKQNKFLQ